MTYRSLITLAVSACLTGAASGCGSTSAIQPLSDCTGSVSMTVTAGTQPTISWTPRCNAYLLVVELSSTGHDAWSITSSGGNAIAPGVVYGVAPTGAQASQAATPLVAGQVYTAALRRYVAGSTDGALIGTQTFVP